MTLQPGLDLGMLVRAVVVEHQMQRYRAGELIVQAAQEAKELLVPVAFKALTHDASLQDVQGGEEGRGAVAFIVVGHRAAATLLHR